MVEGHQCHRVAAAHRKVLVGHAFQVRSPNGRFAAGAAAIDGRRLAKIEVHGKNLFYFFERAAQHTAHEVMHIHFGMSGAFKVMKQPGTPPTDTTRVELKSDSLDLVAYVSAMTCNHGDDAYYQLRSFCRTATREKITKLGPDPLREDADVELLWQKVQKSSKPIGLVLMDQSMVAGIGNIYRAEILFKARVHPEQPANTVTEQEFAALWKHSVELLQRGYVTGSILTVDDADARRLGQPWTRRYIYNHRTCGFCGSPVRSWDMANRTVYACESCQQLRRGVELTPQRRKALAAARDSKEFVSHCASESAATLSLDKMTVAQLKAKLQETGFTDKLPKLKADLLAVAKLHLAASADAPIATRIAATAAAKASGECTASEPCSGPSASQHERRLEQAKEEDAKRESEGVGDGDNGEMGSHHTAHVAVGLVEHEALDIPAGTDLSKLKMSDLKAALKARGIRYGESPKKAELLELLEWAVANEGNAAAAAVRPEEYNASVITAVVPGTQQFDHVASAAEAAREKERAGENRAVEHVALAVDDTDALIAAAEQRSQRATGEAAKQASSRSGRESAKRPSAALAKARRAAAPSVDTGPIAGPGATSQLAGSGNFRSRKKPRV